MNRLPFPAQAAALLVLLLLAVALPPSAPAAELTHWVALPMLAAPHGVLLAGDEAELRAAILAANAATGRPRIELTADNVLNAPLPPLDNATLAAGVFNGAGYTLDGDGHGPILTVAADTRVIFEDLIITGGGQPEGATVCGGAALVRGDLRDPKTAAEKFDARAVKGRVDTESALMEELIVDQRETWVRETSRPGPSE